MAASTSDRSASPENRLTGYATEAARAALDHAFTVWRRDRAISLIDPENRASIRVAERLGEWPQGRTGIFGREMLVYGIDRRPG